MKQKDNIIIVIVMFLFILWIFALCSYGSLQHQINSLPHKYCHNETTIETKNIHACEVKPEEVGFYWCWSQIWIEKDKLIYCDKDFFLKSYHDSDFNVDYFLITSTGNTTCQIKGESKEVCEIR